MLLVLSMPSPYEIECLMNYYGLDYPIMSFWSSVEDLDVHATSVHEFTMRNGYL